MFERLYTLLEATLTLYPAAADGTPITASPVWFGACVNDLRLAERMMIRQTTPGASRYPRNHPLVATHEISIGRLWTSHEPSLSDYLLNSNRYVMDIVWAAEDFDGWRRRTYYGVTAKNYDLSSQERIQFNAEQSFDAEYYQQSAGTGTPPGLSSSLAYTVVWISDAEPPLVLYDYNPATFLFTERLVGQAATRATITVGAIFASTTINFTGGSGNALFITTGQVTQTGQIIEWSPTSADVPRLDFMYGPIRVASVVKSNELMVDTLVEATPSAGAARFRLFGGNVLAATLEPTASTFESLQEV